MRTNIDKPSTESPFLLAANNLPQNFVQRLMKDGSGNNSYKRVNDIHELEALPPNAGYLKWKFGGFLHLTILIQSGKIGLLQDNEKFLFLAAGYHRYSSFGRKFLGAHDINTIDNAITNGPSGFVTINEGNIGVMQLGQDYKLLPPGIYQWNSPIVNNVSIVDITKNVAQLGPYTLVTVPQGRVAVTYNNGNLHVLGNKNADEREEQSRTYFLDNPKWKCVGFLSTQTQTDRLEGNDLLSKDNVEIVMVAMSEWRIIRPDLAIINCGDDMEQIRGKVNQLVRATIARIVAGTNIGTGPVSGGTTRPIMQGIPIDEAEKTDMLKKQNDLAHLMQSEQANKHMSELSRNMQEMGIEVVSVYVPEKRIKNDDTRQQIAKQSVIQIQADAEKSSADARAYATIKHAEAEAHAKQLSSEAEANAIRAIAQAQKEAGEMLGSPNSTAAKMALTTTAGRALAETGGRVTFFGDSAKNVTTMLVPDSMARAHS